MPYDQFPGKCNELLFSEKLHWVLKSDIARWLIIWLYGGVYSDTDVECLKPMDRFLDDKAFCAHSITPNIVGNAVFGGISGYQLFLDIACAEAEKISSNIEGANKTIVDYGVNLAGKMLLQCEKIYPAEYFYPVSWGQRREGRARPASDYPDAYCMHHWSGMDEDGWYSETIGAGRRVRSIRQQAEPAATYVFYGKNTPQAMKKVPESRRAVSCRRLVAMEEPKPILGGAIIPKIIHRIWIGGKPIDEKTEKYIESQKVICRDYHHFLWTDEKIKEIHEFIYPSSLQMLNDDRLNPVIGSDILRYELLRLFGGIYLDTDVEILKSFDEFLVMPFFCGMESKDKIGSAILGSIPYYPVCSEMSKKIYANYLDRGIPKNSYQQLIFGGPYLLTDIIKNHPSIRPFPHEYFYHSNKPAENITLHFFYGGKDKNGWTHQLRQPNRFNPL